MAQTVTGHPNPDGVDAQEVNDMALDEYLESEVAVAVAATAVALSPAVRRVLRRGAVYGVAGALRAADVATAAARGVARGASGASDTGPTEDGRADTAQAGPGPTTA